jgi:adenosylcobinamide-phosphate synthase
VPDVQALLCAAVLELLVGEPPAAWHPVVWMGRTASVLEGLLFRGSAWQQRVGGLVLALGLPALFAAAAAWLLDALSRQPAARTLATGVLLWCVLSVRALGRAAEDVVAALDADLELARQRLRSLCSRDASGLDREELLGATIESVTENTADSIVAPLFYFALFGLPGAVLFRAVNTLDAMVGYRGRYEHFGKATARLDDVLGWIPARLTALSFVLTARLAGGSGWAGARVGRLHHGRTLSPNAGWTMATAAGVLGVRLCKRGEYSLGEPGHPIEIGDVRRAWRLSLLSTGLAFVLTAAAAAFRARFA